MPFLRSRTNIIEFYQVENQDVRGSLLFDRGRVCSDVNASFIRIAAPMDALSTKNFKLWLFGNPKQR